MSSERRHCPLRMAGGWWLVAGGENEGLFVWRRAWNLRWVFPPFLVLVLELLPPFSPKPAISMEVDYPQVEEASTALAPPQDGDARSLSTTPGAVAHA